MAFAAFNLVIERNAIGFKAFAAPCAIVLRRAMRASPAVDFFGQF